MSKKDKINSTGKYCAVLQKIEVDYFSIEVVSYWFMYYNWKNFSDFVNLYSVAENSTANYHCFEKYYYRKWNLKFIAAA